MIVETLTSPTFTTLIVKSIIVVAAEPSSKRTPFNVMLSEPDSPSLSDGNYRLWPDGEESWRLKNIYLNRIIPLAESDATRTFYQVIFGCKQEA